MLGMALARTHLHQRIEAARRDHLLESPYERAMASPAAFAALTSGGRWTLAPHLEHLDAVTMRVANGELTRVMVFMPPRHGKSEYVSRYLPAWWLCRFPDQRIIHTSYAASFSRLWGRRTRNVIAEWGPRLAGIDVSDESSAADEWEIAGHTGGMKSTGVGGDVTGRGGNLIIIDDPVKNAEEALSQTVQESNWEWWESTLRTRLEPGGAIFLVQTRWAEFDLGGRLKDAMREGGDQWEIVEFPAVAEEHDALGRQPGEALWPQRWPLDALERIQGGLSAYWWQSLYQQHPTPPSGSIFKWSYLSHRWTAQPRPAFVGMYVDSAWKTGVANDYSVIAVWGTDGVWLYLLDVWRDKVESPDLNTAIVTYAGKWRPERVVIEDTAAGTASIQSLRRTHALPIIPWQPHGSKVQRAEAVSGFFESGKVLLPPDGPDFPWLNEWIVEHVRFPGGHDDQVDTTSMALEDMYKRVISQERSRESYPDGGAPTAPPAGADPWAVQDGLVEE